MANILRVTFKATADAIATMGVMVMGESDESTPVAVVREQMCSGQIGNSLGKTWLLSHLRISTFALIWSYPPRNDI